MTANQALTEVDLQSAVNSLRAYLDAEVEPLVRQYREKFIPKQTMLAIVERLVSFGLVVAPFPEDVGGWGLSWELHMQLFEEVCYTSSDIGLALSINAIGGQLLLKAPEHIRSRYLPLVLSGKALLSVCISEPDVGSDVASIKIRARREGSDYVINGEKT